MDFWSSSIRGHCGSNVPAGPQSLYRQLACVHYAAALAKGSSGNRIRKICVDGERLLVKRWFGGSFEVTAQPNCRERPQLSPDQPFVNRPTLAEVPLTGLSL